MNTPMQMPHRIVHLSSTAHRLPCNKTSKNFGIDSVTQTRLPQYFKYFKIQVFIIFDEAVGGVDAKSCWKYNTYWNFPTKFCIFFLCFCSEPFQMEKSGYYEDYSVKRWFFWVVVYKNCMDEPVSRRLSFLSWPSAEIHFILHFIFFAHLFDILFRIWLVFIAILYVAKPFEA